MNKMAAVKLWVQKIASQWVAKRNAAYGDDDADNGIDTDIEEEEEFNPAQSRAEIDEKRWKKQVEELEESKKKTEKLIEEVEKRIPSESDHKYDWFIRLAVLEGVLGLKNSELVLRRKTPAQTAELFTAFPDMNPEWFNPKSFTMARASKAYLLFELHKLQNRYMSPEAIINSAIMHLSPTTNKKLQKSQGPLWAVGHALARRILSGKETPSSVMSYVKRGFLAVRSQWITRQQQRELLERTPQNAEGEAPRREPFRDPTLPENPKMPRRRIIKTPGQPDTEELVYSDVYTTDYEPINSITKERIDVIMHLLRDKDHPHSPRTKEIAEQIWNGLVKDWKDEDEYSAPSRGQFGHHVAKTMIADFMAFKKGVKNYDSPGTVDFLATNMKIDLSNTKTKNAFSMAVSNWRKTGHKLIDETFEDRDVQKLLLEFFSLKGLNLIKHTVDSSKDIKMYNRYLDRTARDLLKKKSSLNFAKYDQFMRLAILEGAFDFRPGILLDKPIHAVGDKLSTELPGIDPAWWQAGSTGMAEAIYRKVQTKLLSVEKKLNPDLGVRTSHEVEDVIQAAVSGISLVTHKVLSKGGPFRMVGTHLKNKIFSGEETPETVMRLLVFLLLEGPKSYFMGHVVRSVQRAHTYLERRKPSSDAASADMEQYYHKYDEGIPTVSTPSSLETVVVRDLLQTPRHPLAFKILTVALREGKKQDTKNLANIDLNKPEEEKLKDKLYQTMLEVFKAWRADKQIDQAESEARKVLTKRFDVSNAAVGNWLIEVRRILGKVINNPQIYKLVETYYNQTNPYNKVARLADRVLRQKTVVLA